MTDEEMRAHAQRILDAHIEGIEYLDVVEDEEIWLADPDLTVGHLTTIYDLIRNARGVLR